MYRVVTVGREYGSGGGDIARRVAGHLGWKLIDNALIEEIARTAQVDPKLCARFDECVDPWLHRMRKGLWQGGFEGSVAVDEGGVFDADAMHEFAGRLIRHAAEAGECVIVGRGSQCVLQKRPDTFHVFLYAPWQERVRRVRERQKGNPETLIQEMEQRRAAYIRRYFSQDWRNPHLYHIMLCSSLGEEAAAGIILCAMGQSK